MKVYINASNSATVSMIEWLRGDEVSTMMKTMKAREKRIIGKIANSPDPTIYIGAIADMIDLLEIQVSESFDTFMHDAVEVFHA